MIRGEATRKAAVRRRPIESESVWLAEDVVDPGTWSVDLSAEQRAEIIAAARAADDQGTTTTSLARDEFGLPSLTAELAEWTRALDAGRGFVRIRRFPIEELTERQVELAYVGLGLQLGKPVSQNASGHLLGHVRDERQPRVDPSIRLYQTNQRQDFHTDGADIVGLLCLRPARLGGQSRIASSAAVYNRILAERPDLIEVLYEPMHWDRNGEERPGESPFFAMPVLNDIAGSPRMFFIAWYIRDAQRHPAAPRLTGAQAEAIEMIERIANDDLVHLKMDFQPGDIQLLSNARILHCREAYEDEPEPERRRHLLRLWLAAHSFASVDEVLRGGIPQRDFTEGVTERS
ncbi:MAG: TauD/TfdA family dioxygenase [Acidimicrobiales bacterium]